METVTIPKSEYEQLKAEAKMLRNTSLYRKLLEAENDMKSGRAVTRRELGI